MTAVGELGHGSYGVDRYQRKAIEVRAARTVVGSIHSRPGNSARRNAITGRDSHHARRPNKTVIVDARASEV